MALALAAILAASIAGAQTIPSLVTTAPNPAYALPGGFDTFAPPINAVSGTTDASASTVAANSMLAFPGRAIALTGENLNTAYMWNQTTSTNGQLLTLTALSNSTENWLYNVPLQALSNACYMVWSSTQAGTALSLPVMMNQAQLWWCDNQGNSGGGLTISDTVKAYGMNLQYGGVTPVVVYNQTGVTTVAATVVTATTDAISYNVPAVANGYWNVWVHNGHGGQWGWSGPVGVTVNSAAVLAYSVSVNAKTANGAVGDGVTDDTNAITKTVATCDGNSKTAYFPAGTYLFSSKIQFKKDIRILGDGAGLTHFLSVTNYADAYAMGDTSGQTNWNIILQNFSVEMRHVSSSAMNGVGNGVIIATRETNWTAVGVSITCDYNYFNSTSLNAFVFATGGSANTVGYVNISGCATFAYGCAVNPPNNTKMCYNQIYGRLDGGNNGAAGMNGFEFGFNNPAPGDFDGTTSTGFSAGRGLDLTNSGRGAQNIDAHDNTSLGTGVAATKSDQNAGEWIMVESGSNGQGQQLTITSATIQGCVISNDGTSKYLTNSAGIAWGIKIVKGPGTGQLRGIVTDAAGTLGLDAPWNQIPTSSSYAVLESFDRNIFIGRNVKTGNGRKASSAGVQIYGTCENCYITQNQLSGTAYGLYVMPLIYSPTQFYTIGFIYSWANLLQNDLTGGIFDSAQFNAAASNKEGIYSLDNFFFDNYISQPGSGWAVSTNISDLNSCLTCTTEVLMDGQVFQRNEVQLYNGTVGVSNTAGTTRLINSPQSDNGWNVRPAQASGLGLGFSY